MVDLARAYVPDAEAVEALRLPSDRVPDADAIVSVGHPLSYLDDEEQLDQALSSMSGALRADGVLAFDVCDFRWGEARRDQAPLVRFGDEWVLITRTSVPEPRIFRREMTMFVRADEELWRRDDELHDNVLVDTSLIPSFLGVHGVEAAVRSGFGDEVLPTGLVAVVGTRTNG
jgi:hypothetical protein